MNKNLDALWLEEMEPHVDGKIIRYLRTHHERYAMHEKPSLIMLLSAKQETSHLLGADAEERQARQLIMHRNQEQYRNSLSKRKRNDPER